MRVLLFLFLLILSVPGISQPKHAAYDPVLAKNLGADEYGMRQYVMAFLKPGPKQVIDSAQRVALSKAHLKNIVRLADEGKLIVAGPFLNEGAYAGIFIFNVSTIEEAKALTASDPEIQAGVLEMELRPWYGTAALMEVAARHKKLQKKNIADSF